MRLGFKIILIFLTISTIIYLVIFLITNFLAQREFFNLINNNDQLLLKNKIYSLDRITYRRIETWDFYINNNQTIRDTLILSNKEFEELTNINNYIEEKDKLWINDSNSEIKNFVSEIINNQGSLALINAREFYKNKNGYQIFPEVFVTNKFGAVVAMTNKTSDYNQADEVWWDKAVKNGNFIEDVGYDQSSGVYGINICLRINDKNNNLLGVAKIVYDIKDISQVIEELADQTLSNKLTDFKLLNKEGQLIYSHQNGFGNFNDQGYLLKLISSTGNKKNGFLNFQDQSGKNKVIEFITSTGYKDYGGLGWILILEQDSGVIFSPVNQLRNIMVISFGLGLFLMMWGGLIIRNFISKPIKKLKMGVEVIENGNFNYKTSINSKDEIGDLSRSFDKMTEKLKESYETMETKIQERTKELDKKVKELDQSEQTLISILDDLEDNKEKIEKEKAQDEALLESIGDGTIATNENREIIFMSRSAEEMTGYKFSEARGRHISEIINIEDEGGKVISSEQRPMHLALASKTKINKIYYFVVRDKKRFPAAVTATPVILKERIIGAILVFRDITKEREIDKAKTEFVSLASHQLRTPLSTISWYAEILMAGDAGKLNTEQKKYLDEIYKGNQRMVSLVNALLNVSRIELGTFIVEPEPTNIIEIVKSVIEENRPRIETKKIVIKEFYPENLPLINVDSKLTRIVFQNLISNAVKYTSNEGNVLVEMQIYRSGAELNGQKIDKDILFVKVSDNGYGIPKTQQDKIFSKLFRADNAKEKETEGTGLGLYIAKSIIESSGGKIWFESEENKGSTFYFTLPLEGMKKKEGTRKLD